MIEILDKFLTNYGFGVTLTIAICFAFWRVLNWLKEEQDKRTTILLGIIDGQKFILEGFRKSIDEHTEKDREFHLQMAEANKHQREEHEEMIEILGRINGYKH